MIRDFRIYGIAVIDVVASLFIFYIAMIYLYPDMKGKYLYALLAIPLGIIVHYMFGVKTTLNNYLGLSVKPNN